MTLDDKIRRMAASHGGGEGDVRVLKCAHELLAQAVDLPSHTEAWYALMIALGSFCRSLDMDRDTVIRAFAHVFDQQETTAEKSLPIERPA